MIKTLFLLGVVFVLTYDPQAGGLDNVVRHHQQSPTSTVAASQHGQANAPAPPPLNKHQHYEALQLGQEGYQYRTNMPGAALY